jgi:DNA-binding response OmpR family regulator
MARQGLEHLLHQVQVLLVVSEEARREELRLALLGCGALVMAPDSVDRATRYARTVAPDVALIDVHDFGEPLMALVGIVANTRLAEGRRPLVIALAPWQSTETRVALTAAGFSDVLPIGVDSRTLCFTLGRALGRLG